MKRKALMGVLSGLIILSCEPPPDTHNDINYPAWFYMAGEVPGDPITLELRLSFEDQTPDTSGVVFDWGQRGDTLWFLLKGADCDIESDSLYNDGRSMYVDLDTGTYTLLFEGEEGAKDTFGFVVEDSLYRFVHRHKTSIYDSISGKVVFFHDSQHDTLRRIFPDMLLVEAGARQSGIDSIKQALIGLGVVECHVKAGTYAMFNVYGSDPTWAVAGSREGDDWNLYLDYAGSLLFTYDGDTMRLDSFFKSPPVNVGALSMRMGNGFDRYYRWWVE